MKKQTTFRIELNKEQKQKLINLFEKGFNFEDKLLIELDEDQHNLLFEELFQSGIYDDWIFDWARDKMRPGM